ncbi:hypothetical protein K469DRAFT_690648 [Zopfia rhizophila CBS 207.26]|uniref:Protein kinase domain-containing protein n=1 Tax=Zopfia rhizophila CBS 207.26 TaxID=1314779 RepID=A0A6A6DWF8_9PEZI|nr:hypothetical protein K469DRAFT_690648 [Zopfia rhizophila CBS 207.26]
MAKFLEYAPFVSLDDLIRRYLSDGGQIPKAFVWLVFKNLVSACHIMQKGDDLQNNKEWREVCGSGSDEDESDQDGSDGKRWTGVVGTDIKPENILLQNRQGNNCSAFKFLLLSDSGLVHNPDEMMLGATRTGGFLAHEQYTTYYVTPIKR